MKQFKLANLCTLLLGVTLLASPLFAQSKADKKAKKEEEKFWKDKSKNYVKNPLSLKGEFEKYQNEIQNQKERISGLEQENVMQVNKLNGSKSQIDSLKWEAVQLKGESSAMKKKQEKMELELKSVKKAEAQDIRMGINYRAQIGAFVNFQMGVKPENGPDFQYDKADGFNKYLVGNFRTQSECDAFRDELKKTGVRDAFTVPFIDGVRVTFAEADAFLAKQGVGNQRMEEPMPTGEKTASEGSSKPKFNSGAGTGTGTKPKSSTTMGGSTSKPK